MNIIIRLKFNSAEKKKSALINLKRRIPVKKVKWNGGASVAEVAEIVSCDATDIHANFAANNRRE